MNTYKLDSSANFYINCSIFALCLTCLGALIEAIIGVSSISILIIVSCLILFSLIYLIYLIRIKLKLSHYRFYSVTVDKEELRFIFTTKKSENCYVNFNDVESIYMIRSAVYRGCYHGTWYVNVKTYKGNDYSIFIAITAMSDFYADLPAEMNKIIKEDANKPLFTF